MYGTTSATRSSQVFNLFRLGGLQQIAEDSTLESVTKELTMYLVPQFRLFNPEGIVATTGYSNVAEITRGKLIYISGQVARDVSGELVGEEDFRAQVEQVFQNVNVAVEAAGGTFANIVKLNYYCADSVEPSHYPIVKEIRDRFVDIDRPPVSTFVVVRRLIRPEWLIEVEAVAVVPGSSRLSPKSGNGRFTVSSPDKQQAPS
jgi:enamine deaminase RidA (YjgF/YER057c/UK114 family)